VSTGWSRQWAVLRVTRLTPGVRWEDTTDRDSIGLPMGACGWHRLRSPPNPPIAGRNGRSGETSRL